MPKQGCDRLSAPRVSCDNFTPLAILGWLNQTPLILNKSALFPSIPLISPLFPSATYYESILINSIMGLRWGCWGCGELADTGRKRQ